ncbi:hydrogenase small subunit [Desulfitobacterium hafniense]|uniref:hydrogenase small subunit n=1 Tax=Desulfitobacterium hafniense TaxID=49338 RepID=UPI00036590D5|nr:hydrogenase small subunit [Desulfitobacterium hafniense]
MLNRREFLKLVVKGAILGNFISLVTPELEKALAQGEINKLPIIMVETGTCTGDSISLDNIWSPTLSDIFTNITEWRYDWTMMQSQGELAYDVLLEIEKNQAHEFVLLVQGSMIRRDGGHYNYAGLENGQLITGLDLVRRLGLKAKYVVAVGHCATYGGPVAGYPNPTQSTGVQNILPERRVINVSGCPAHPDWIMGTLLHLALYGEPELEKFGRPKMFFGETIHNNCPRRRYYDQGIFATDIGQKECLYRVGCKGPVTYADCPIRRWNDHYNWPIGCNSPCIGCTEPGYPDLMEPFTAHFPDIPFPGGSRAATDRIGRGVLGLATLGIGGYFLSSFYKGRLHRNFIRSTIKEKKKKIKVKKVKFCHHYRPKESKE